jgi:hypothetical protein
VHLPASCLQLIQNDYSGSLLHMRQGEHAVEAPALLLLLVPQLLARAAHHPLMMQVIGNKWDSYLDLLTNGYEEG